MVNFTIDQIKENMSNQDNIRNFTVIAQYKNNKFSGSIMESQL